MYLLAIRMSSMKKNVSSGLCLFLNWVVCFFDVELYELFLLDIIPLLVISFADIFSHSVGYPFVLSMVSFGMQKPLISSWDNSSIYLIILTLTIISWYLKYICNQDFIYIKIHI